MAKLGKFLIIAFFVGLIAHKGADIWQETQASKVIATITVTPATWEAVEGVAQPSHKANPVKAWKDYAAWESKYLAKVMKMPSQDRTELLKRIKEVDKVFQRSMDESDLDASKFELAATCKYITGRLLYNLSFMK